MIALFPGQGSQQVGMGKELFQDFSVAREVFEEASDATHKDLKRLCFDGPESDLQATENTQPCLLTVSIAAFRVAAAEAGFKPDLVAGHSLGEYSALVAAGALKLNVAVSWVNARGKAMQEAVPLGQGAMAAVLGLDPERITQLCEKATDAAQLKRVERPELTVAPIVEPANFNSYEQIVLAGSTDGIDEALTLIQSGAYGSAKAIPLAVSAPFHCILMRPARDKMAEIFSRSLASDRPKELLFPYVPNRTARITHEPGVVLELLVEQVDHPVLWTQSVEAFLLAGEDHAVEFGPGKILQGLVKRIAKKREAKMDLKSFATTADLKILGKP